MHGLANVKFVIVTVGLMVCYHTYTFRYNQARSQIVSVAASSLGACTYLRLFSDGMLFYTYIVYAHYVCISVERTSVRTYKVNWLRHCTTSRKFAGSISSGVTGIFHWLNPSGRGMTVGSTHPLSEMMTRNIS